MYKRANSSVLVGFIDASKAFDRINHHKLFTKLSLRGVPGTITRILAFWYANQKMQIKWGDTVSSVLPSVLAMVFVRVEYSLQGFLIFIWTIYLNSYEPVKRDV